MSGDVGAYLNACSARSEVRGATSDPRCGVAKRGADGPARRSSSVSRGVMDRGHRQFLAADRRGPRQDDQAVKTKPLTGSCLRILDQGLGPTRARSSRNRPLEPLRTMARLAQGWAGHPCHTRRMRLTSTGTPAPDVDASAWSRAGRIGNAQFASHRSLLCEDALPVVPQPIEQGPGHSAVPFRDGRPFS